MEQSQGRRRPKLITFKGIVFYLEGNLYFIESSPFVNVNVKNKKEDLLARFHKI